MLRSVGHASVLHPYLTHMTDSELRRIANICCDVEAAVEMDCQVDINGNGYSASEASGVSRAIMEILFSPSWRRDYEPEIAAKIKELENVR